MKTVLDMFWRIEGEMTRTELDEDVAMVCEEVISIQDDELLTHVRYEEHCERGVELVSFEMGVGLQTSDPRNQTVFKFGLYGE